MLLACYSYIGNTIFQPSTFLSRIVSTSNRILANGRDSVCVCCAIPILGSQSSEVNENISKWHITQPEKKSAKSVLYLTFIHFPIALSSFSSVHPHLLRLVLRLRTFKCAFSQLIIVLRLASKLDLMFILNMAAKQQKKPIALPPNKVSANGCLYRAKKAAGKQSLS